MEKKPKDQELTYLPPGGGTNKQRNKQTRTKLKPKELTYLQPGKGTREKNQTNKQTNKKINNSLISGLVKALVQAPSQVNVPQGAGEVGADYRLPVTLEGHRLLVIPGKEECVIPLQS